MKLLFRTMIAVSLLAVSACNVHLPRSAENTATGRAAYGDVAPDFRVHKKKNRKIRNQARKAAQRDHAKNDKLYGHGRPY